MRHPVQTRQTPPTARRKQAHSIETGLHIARVRNALQTHTRSITATLRTNHQQQSIGAVIWGVPGAPTTDSQHRANSARCISTAHHKRTKHIDRSLLTAQTKQRLHNRASETGMEGQERRGWLAHHCNTSGVMMSQFSPDCACILQAPVFGFLAKICKNSGKFQYTDAPISPSPFETN
eukprot:3934033-Rhodomonas_salina.2